MYSLLSPFCIHCYFVQRSTPVSSNFYACKLCPPPSPHFVGKFTRRGLRIHLIRVHQSDLIRRRYLSGNWQDDIVQLSPDELFKQQNRLLIRFAKNKEQKHEIYANLYVHEMCKRIAAQPNAGGDKNGLLNTNSLDVAVASSTQIPVTLHDRVGLIGEQQLPTDLATEKHENRSDCDADMLQVDSSCMSPVTWELDNSFHYLPEIGMGETVFTSDNKSAVTTDEVADTVNGLDRVSHVTMLNYHSGAHDNSMIPEKLYTPFLASSGLDQEEDKSETQVQQHVNRPTTTAPPQSEDQLLLSVMSQVRKEEDSEKQQRRDLILQIIAERNTFHRQPDHLIAARIADRCNSVMSFTEVENILYAINESEKIFTDKLSGIIAMALNTETSGQLAIAMIIQELRTRGRL